MSERAEIAFFTDLAGNEVYVGDRVAVAVASKYYDGLRLGNVLEITGRFDDEAGKYVDIRVKVRVDTTTGFAGSKFNYETKQWESKPYFKTYDAANRVVKIG